MVDRRRPEGKGWRNIYYGDSIRHSLSARGIKNANIRNPNYKDSRDLVRSIRLYDEVVNKDEDRDFGEEHADIIDDLIEVENRERENRERLQRSNESITDFSPKFLKEVYRETDRERNLQTAHKNEPFTTIDPEHVSYTGGLVHKTRKPEIRYSLDYPIPFARKDRFLFNNEMIKSGSPEENQKIFDKWYNWKKERKGTKTYRIIVDIESPELKYVTKSTIPPDGYRWASREEHMEGRRSIIGELKQDGTPSEENKPFYTADRMYSIGQFNQGQIQYDRSHIRKTTGGKRKYRQTEEMKGLREKIEERKKREMGWVPPEDYYEVKKNE